MARRNPSTRRAWWIGGLVAVAALGIGVTAFAMSKQNKPALIYPATLNANERYRIALNGPTNSQLQTTMTVASVQSALDQATTPGLFKVAALSYQTTPTVAIIVLVDMTSSYTVPPPPTSVVQQLQQQGMSLVVTDVGPTPVPGTLVTDPTQVTTYQNELASIVAAGTVSLPSGTSYQASNVNGNPQDPTFVAALAVFQQWIDLGFGQSIGIVQPNINTQGVLDSDTSSALAWVSTHQGGQA
jgi:hypothetical protein